MSTKTPLHTSNLATWTMIKKNILLEKKQLAPENQWLEDEISFWDGPFSGATLVSVYKATVLLPAPILIFPFSPRLYHAAAGAKPFTSWLLPIRPWTEGARDRDAIPQVDQSWDA